MADTFIADQEPGFAFNSDGRAICDLFEPFIARPVKIKCKVLRDGQRVSPIAAVDMLKHSQTTFRMTMELHTAEDPRLNLPFQVVPCTEFQIVGFALLTDLRAQLHHHRPCGQNLVQCQDIGTKVPKHFTPWDHTGSNILLVGTPMQKLPEELHEFELYALLNQIQTNGICTAHPINAHDVFFRSEFRTRSTSVFSMAICNEWQRTAVYMAIHGRPPVNTHAANQSRSASALMSVDRTLQQLQVQVQFGLVTTMEVVAALHAQRQILEPVIERHLREEGDLDRAIADTMARSCSGHRGSGYRGHVAVGLGITMMDDGAHASDDSAMQMQDDGGLLGGILPSIEEDSTEEGAAEEDLVGMDRDSIIFDAANTLNPPAEWPTLDNPHHMYYDGPLTEDFASRMTGDGAQAEGSMPQNGGLFGGIRRSYEIDNTDLWSSCDDATSVGTSIFDDSAHSSPVPYTEESG